MGFAAALRMQLNVLHALMLRETRTRFGAHQLGYLWALIEPLMWIATFYLLFKFMDRRLPVGMDPVSFLTTGLIPFLMFRQNLNQLLNAINASKGLLFYPRIRPLDLMFARAGLEMATLGMVFIVIMGFNALYQGQLAVHDPLQVLAGLVLACLLGIGCGIFTGALFSFSSAVLRIIPILLRPLIWISGLWM